MANPACAPAAHTVIYCGELSLLGDFPTSLVRPLEVVPPSELLPRLQLPAHSISTIILTLADVHSARFGVSVEELAANSALVMADLARLETLPTRPTVILLTQSGLALDACCAFVKCGVSHFVDMDCPTWQSRLRDLLRHDDESGFFTARSPRNAIELLDTVGIRAVSPAMQTLILNVYRGAQVSDATVLIQGESGTGKQLLAEAVHQLDPKRNAMPFVPVNCAAITGTLAESELFGHTKGAFSGATDPRLGYFRSANRGTIFLDEISELPMHLQPKLLRVLQERRVMPVGSDKEEAIDVRVIAASNVPLQEKVAKGEFRLDLYQRLNVIHLALPPLRQRTEDIPLLVQHFVRKYAHYSQRPVRDIDPRVFELLKRKAGSGNVRELENIVRQALVFKSAGDRFELQDLPRTLLEGTEHAPPKEIIPSDIANNLVELIRSRRLSLKQVVEAFEKSIIRSASQSSPTLSKVELAKVLGVPRRTLYYKLEADGAEKLPLAD